MDLLATLPPWAWIAAAAVLVLVLGIGLAVWWRRRNRTLEQRLRKLSRAMLSEVVIPDGNGGEIEVQYALLTHQGIVLADVKDVEGHVFGSEGMQDWTVLAKDRRFTFPNPQPGLWDRVAAVKRLVPEEVPVGGYIAFTERASFSKGQPRGVVSIPELLRELSRDPQPGAPAADVYLPAWDRLREAAITARMDHLIKGSR